MNEHDSTVDELIEQLQDANQIAKDSQKKDDFSLDKDELEKFLLHNSGKLIQDSVGFMATFQEFITSAPDYKDVEAYSKLVGASAAAIESLNKILLNDKKIEATKEIKQMDIDSKKEITDANNTTKILLNREELMDQLIQKAEVIDVVTTEKSESSE